MKSICLRENEVRALLTEGAVEVRRNLNPQPKVMRGCHITRCGGWAEGVWSAIDQIGAWRHNVRMADTWVDKECQPLRHNSSDPKTTRLYRREPSPFGMLYRVIVVKETYCLETNRGIASNEEYPPPFNDGRPVNHKDGYELWGQYWEQAHYKATDPIPELCYEDCKCDLSCEPHCHWCSPVTMPLWAVRLYAVVTALAVRQEDGLWWWVGRLERSRNENSHSQDLA